MKGLKKITAAVLAAAMAVTFAACGQDASWVAKYEDETMPVGTYIATMLDKYAYQYMMYGSDKVLEEKVDDKTVGEAIQEESKQNVASALAIMKKAKDLGITLTEEEIQLANTSVSATWENNKALYEKNGIAKTSVEKLAQISVLSEKVFQAIYGEGGEAEVPAEELNAYYEDNYAKAGMMIFEKPEQQTLDENATEDEKAAAELSHENALKSLQQEANYWNVKAMEMKGKGQSFNDVMIAYSMETAEDPSTVDQTENRYVLVKLDDTRIPQVVRDGLREAELDTPTMVQDDNYIVIYSKQDMKEDPADFESVEFDILASLRNDAYQELVDELIAELDIQYNDVALKKYVPKKIDLE